LKASSSIYVVWIQSLPDLFHRVKHLVGLHITLDLLLDARYVSSNSNKFIETCLFKPSQHIIDCGICERNHQNTFLHSSQNPNQNYNSCSLARSWCTQHHMVIRSQDTLKNCYLLLFVQNFKFIFIFPVKVINLVQTWCFRCFLVNDRVPHHTEIFLNTKTKDIVSHYWIAESAKWL